MGHQAVSQSLGLRTAGTTVLKAVGDICPGDVSIMGLGICSVMQRHGVDFPLRNARDLLLGADVLIGNLEGILSSVVTKGGAPRYTFCGPPGFARALRAAGFTVINVANNHALEHGAEKFQETVHHLRAAGILVCGLRDNGPYYSKPVFVAHGGRRIGILGYNWVGKDKFPAADLCIAQSHDSIVNYTWGRNHAQDKAAQESVHLRNSNVRADIATLRKDADFVILVAHWGYELVHYPPYGVTLEARSFVDAGADLILGGHPHVLQGTECYKGKYIVYSLGNFLFDMRTSQSSIALILEAQIDAGNQVRLDSVPVARNRHFQPSRLPAAQRRRAERILALSAAGLAPEERQRQLDDDKVYREFEKCYNRSKLHSILQYLWVLPCHPFVLRIIGRKSLNFLALLRNRLRGERVRW